MSISFTGIGVMHHANPIEPPHYGSVSGTANQSFSIGHNLVVVGVLAPRSMGQTSRPLLCKTVQLTDGDGQEEGMRQEN